MTLGARLRRWKEEGRLAPEQFDLLSGLTTLETFSLVPELSASLYLGVIAIAVGLGMTIHAYFSSLGDIAILAVLSTVVTGCLYYCARHAPPYSQERTETGSLAFDYILYLGCLVFSVELGYIELRFHVLKSQWDFYLLGSALLFFVLAYRMDNRFVLGLALSTLGGWFGIRLQTWIGLPDARLRLCAFVFGAAVGLGGMALSRANIKKHFLGTYLHVALNVLLLASVSGLIQDSRPMLYLVLLTLLCAASWWHGTRKGVLSHVVYAVLYGYVGLTVWLFQTWDLGRSVTMVLLYFLVSSVGVVVLLVSLARRLRRNRP